jgi:hypothetical protein
MNTPCRFFRKRIPASVKKETGRGMIRNALRLLCGVLGIVRELRRIPDGKILIYFL